jgi:putative two-component system response regulator
MSATTNVYDQLSNSPVDSAQNSECILIVDDDAVVREILARKLANLGYICECCANARTALDLLAGRKFDLVLADICIPGAGGEGFLNQTLKVSPDIAVILLASTIDIEAAVDYLKDGAYDYVTKPFSLGKMAVSVSRALEKRRLLLENQSYQRTLEDQVESRAHQLKEAMGVLEHTYHSTLVALSKALDSRDAGSDGHSLRVMMYATRLACQLGLSESEIRAIEHGILLHDIGKIGIPDELLRKQGQLNEDEWCLMRKHPEIGYRILSRIKFLNEAAKLVLHHHERYNGQGYPQRLRKDEINRGARIFAVADALDDLTSNRPFQPAASFEAAIREIEKMSGEQLDPTLVEEFLKISASEWKEIRRRIAADTKRADFLRI